MTRCCVLPHLVADGPRNMALDEALLDAVAADPTAAVVRTYAWSTPTLSLGYFQAYAEVEADPRWRGHPVVRRPTGGGALWHDREVTYAVVVPADHPLARPSTALYRAIHGAIGACLREAGVAAGRRGDGPIAADVPGDRPFLCFRDRDDDDVVAGAIKLVGSAQRRRAGAVLQHGSLLLARSPTTPELPGLVDLAGPAAAGDDPVATWGAICRQVLPDLLGGETIWRDFEDRERERADELSREIYESDRWTRRR